MKVSEKLDEFLDHDTIKSFTDFDGTFAPSGYTFTKYDDHIVYYQMEINKLVVPHVGCILVDRDLRVKGSPLPCGFIMDETAV